jgi:TetR/AcrR family transcriptional regulator, transcriptional repressor for nem operon
MNPQPAEPRPSGGARSKLLDAAISIIRKKGYAATSVDELCAWAGVTKGAFFHHFPSKDSLAVAAANHWTELSDALFAAAPYHRLDDPLDRVLGYLDFRKAILRGEVAEFTCLAGTMVQEAYGTHPDIRRACDASIGGHAAKVESDIVDAMKLYHLGAPWTAESLALHTQAVLQGAFILAKATGGAAVVEASIDHLRRYIELLFRRSRETPGRKNRRRREPFARTEFSPRRRERSTAPTSNPKCRGVGSVEERQRDGARVEPDRRQARAARYSPSAGPADGTSLVARCFFSSPLSNPACLIRHGVRDLLRIQASRTKHARRRRRGREPTNLGGEIRQDRDDDANIGQSRSSPHRSEG